MRKDLLPGAVTVLLFWWVVLSFSWLMRYIGGAERMSGSLNSIFGSLSISLMAVLWGMGISSGLIILSRFFVRAQLIGVNYKGIAVSLGPFPVVRLPIPRIKRVTEFMPLMDELVKSYSIKYPKHYALLEAIAEILDAHPLHPASIEPGGHGDRTLVYHSHLVCEFMIKKAGKFDYIGTKLKGKKSNPELMDPLYKFNQNDPLIALAGLGHDIGKIECYEVGLDGVAIEKRSHHDWRGRYILTGLSEFWELPESDRNTLLDVVGYYHHHEEMPLDSADRQRALIALVLEADNEAGIYESNHPKQASIEDVYMMVRRMLIARGKNPDLAEPPDKSLPYDIELNGTKLSLHQSRLLYYFEQLIEEPGSINGSDPDIRIGIKIGDLIYFDEEKVRARLGALLHAKRLMETMKVDGQYVLTTQLIEVLLMRGSLENVVDNHEFGPGRCVFKLVARSTKGKHITDYVWNSVFMVKASAYPKLETLGIEEVDLEVVSIHPIFGWQQARNKSVNRIKSNNLMIQNENAKQAEIVVGHVESESSEATVIDRTEGVAEAFHDAGKKELGDAISAAVGSGMAIPTSRPVKPKKTKREKRTNDQESIKAASPVATNLWWESDDGRLCLNEIIETVRTTDFPTVVKDIEGVMYSIVNLKQIMGLLDIPLTGEEKICNVLGGIDNIILRKNGNGDNFVGIPKNIIENV
jgi:hypothetical protein